LQQDIYRFWGTIGFVVGMLIELVVALFLSSGTHQALLNPTTGRPDVSVVPFWQLSLLPLVLSFIGAFITGIGAVTLVRAKGFPPVLGGLCFIPPTLGVVCYYLYLTGIAVVCILPRRKVMWGETPKTPSETSKKEP
jgi:hypothetical protein